MKIVTARGYITGIIVFDYAARFDEGIEEISQWIENGQIKTREDVYEGIENFGSTLLKLYTGENFGKLLLKV